MGKETVLIVKPKAELKLRIAMAHAKNLEIMWFGELHLNRNNNYVLTDVFFPPQENYAAYVTTNDEKYPSWFFETFISKNKQARIRLHGHSHPTFATNPSSIDNKHTKMFLEECQDYFIQMILSNKYEPYCAIHFFEKGKKSQKVKIVWTYTEKLKKILENQMEVMPNEFKQTRRLLQPDEFEDDNTHNRSRSTRK